MQNGLSVCFLLQHRDWLIQQKYDEFVGSIQLLAVAFNCG